MRNINFFKKNKLLNTANQAYTNEDWKTCIASYAECLKFGFVLNLNHAEQFNKAKIAYKNKHKVINEVAVCGWDLSHNAAGRVLALFDLYNASGFDVQIIGCVVSKDRERPKQLWEPMKMAGFHAKYFDVYNSKDLIYSAFDFVIANPFNLIHLSKPRLPNIIIGRLYQLIWNANVIMDIDDEELGFAHKAMTHTTKVSPSKHELLNIRHSYWLNKSVDLYSSFDAVTVSNLALQQKYGGVIIPHVRNEKHFLIDKSIKKAMREKYDIPLHNWVVLFFGTPKPHKGLIETAQALSQLDRKDVSFVVIGQFVNLALKESLLAIQNVDFRFIGNQPFNEISQHVAIGDVTVLMQNEQSMVAQYQLPAKVIDALAMGLNVITTETPALKPIIASGAAKSASPETLVKILDELFISEKHFNNVGYEYFKKYLSVQANVHKILSCIDSLQMKHYPLKAKTRYNLKYLTKTIL